MTYCVRYDEKCHMKIVSFSCCDGKENINQYSIILHTTTMIKFLNYMTHVAIMITDCIND